MRTTVHRLYAIIAFISALSSLGLVPSVVHSQEQIPTTSLMGLYRSEGVPGGDNVVGDFVVGPGKIDATLKPGESKVVEMLVTNRTGEPRRFNVTVQDATGSQNADTPIVLLGNDRGPYSLRDYISVPHTSFDLAHNERAHVPVTISLPADAEPGGLYGSVLIDTVAIDAVVGDTSGTVPQSAIIARVGTLFFVTVSGDVEKDAELKQFGTSPSKIFYQSSPIDFGILYENRGSIHVMPYGEMRIRNMFDEEVGYVKLDPWFVLPKSLRLREVSWDRDYLFGRYTATVFVNRSYDDVIDEMSYSFWVLPWKPVTLSFVVLFGIIFLIRAFFRKFEFKRKT